MARIDKLLYCIVFIQLPGCVHSGRLDGGIGRDTNLFACRTEAPRSGSYDGVLDVVPVEVPGYSRYNIDQEPVALHVSLSRRVLRVQDPPFAGIVAVPLESSHVLQVTFFLVEDGWVCTSAVLSG